MKFSRLVIFTLSALLPLVSCTTTDPAGAQRGSASYPLKIYPGEDGIWAPQKDLPGKRAQAPGRYHAQGPFPVEMKTVPARKPGDKAPRGMERSVEKRIESPVSEEERERMLEASMHLPPNAKAARGLLSGLAGSMALGPSVGNGWASMDYINSVPPDPEMAAGPNHIIATVNSAFEIYDKNGNVVKAQTDFDNFFSGVCTNTFDPNALYDEDQDRFIIAMDGNGTDYCVAVSQTPDPTGAWNRYAIPTGADFFDYPHAGVGRDAIYVGANIFSNTTNSFLRSEVYAIDKFAMYAGGSTQYVMHSIGSGYFTPQPMNLHGAAQGTWPDFGPHYIISGVYNGNNFYVWSWDDPFGADIFSNLGQFSLNAATGVTAGNTVDQPQLGASTLIQGNDWRALDAEYRNGYVWMSHAIACNPGGGTVNCVRWAQIDPATVSVVNAGVLSTAGEYRSFPDLATDACGNMAVGYTKTSTSMYPAVWVAGREAGDPSGTLQTESEAKAGELTYTAFDGSPYRWGDYTGMTIDPDGSTFWYLGQYSRNTGTTNGRWGTWINSFSFGCVPPNAPPNVSVNPNSVSTVITGGDSDEFVDNCETTTLDFDVRNSGFGDLTGVEIVSVTPVSHPNTVISTSMPVALAATLLQGVTVPASFDFSAVDAAFGDTLQFEIEISANELAPNKVITLNVANAETDRQAVASRTWNFASGLEDWTLVQGTFNHNSGSGADGSPGYLASSANLDNQCDQVRSPVLYLEPNSTLSLSTNYDIEPINQGRYWYDQANVAVLKGSQRSIVDPDSGRAYNADGFGASCVTAGGNGWAGAATSWASSNWSSAALGAAAVAGDAVQLDVAYGTDSSVVRRGFWFDKVTLTNFSTQAPDAQSNNCSAANTRPVVTITAPADNAVFDKGVNVTFTATANDSEDGDISGLIQWDSSLDGSIGNGASFNTSVLSAGTHLVTASVADSGGLDGFDTVTVTLNGPPAVNITSFTASPNPIGEGESTTLSWNVSNATACSGSGVNWSGVKNPVSGSESVTPGSAGNYIYTLSCTGDGDPDSASVTVTVTAQPGTLHIGDIDSASIPGSRGRWDATVIFTVHDGDENPVNGATVSASWVSGATGGFSCVTDASGQCSSTKANLKSNVSSVTVAVTGVSNGSDSYDAGSNHDPDGDSDGTTLLISQNGPPAVSIDSFTASPNPIGEDESTTLSWSVSNATSCTAGGNWSGDKNPAGGSESVTPGLAGNYSYTLNCTDGSTSDNASVTVTVNGGGAVHVASVTGIGTAAARSRWDATATVFVVDAGGLPVANVTVDGAWSNGANGTGNCVTGSGGSCTISKTNIKSNVTSVTFAVTTLTAAGYTYDSSANGTDNVVINQP